MFVLVLLLFLGTVLYDSLTLLKKINKGEKTLYFLMMGLGFIVLSLYSFNVDIPSPSAEIVRVLDSIFKIENGGLPL